MMFTKFYRQYADKDREFSSAELQKIMIGKEYEENWENHSSDETTKVPIDAIREAVINNLAHARYDMDLQHKIDTFSNQISIGYPGAFTNEFSFEDFAVRNLRSFLRNEALSKTLYLCKDIETFGSGLRKIHTLSKDAGVAIGYNNTETDFTLEFSRKDRNITPQDGVINDTINKLVANGLSWLRDDLYLTVPELAEKNEKSQRTLTRALTSLKAKHLIERIGSNKTGYWKV